MLATGAAPPEGLVGDLSATISVAVISLARSTDRRRWMAGQLARLGIPFDFFDAIDGAALSAEQRQMLDPRPIWADYGRALTPAEIGCLASYKLLLSEFAAGSKPFLAVLEDDAELEPDAALLLDEDWLRSLPPFDVLRLQSHRGRPPPGLMVREHGRYKVRAALRGSYGSAAQVFSRAGAAKIAAAIPPVTAALDVLIYRDPQLRLGLLDVLPGAARERLMPSTIGHDRFHRDPRHRRRPDLVLRRAYLLARRRVQAFTSFRAAWGWGRLIRLFGASWT